MRYSAGQAATATGKSIPTITRAIKKGRISAERLEGGGYAIDPAELHRVFPPVTPDSAAPPNALGHETPVLGAENKGLERLVTTLQEQLRELRAERDETVADLRADRDGWRQQAERLALKLPAPANSPAPEPAQPVTVETPTLGQGKRVGGFWSRLLGRVPSND